MPEEDVEVLQKLLAIAHCGDSGRREQETTLSCLQKITLGKV